jgi:glycosyltransferase involved in cell wall biosynthesis
VADPQVRHVPFLDKTQAADRVALAALYREATLFFLPTRAECAGVVFSEAAAFGLPIVSTDTGGVATAVRDGVTGRLLPLAAGGAEYARAIADLLADPVALTRMRAAARAAYESRLNWDAWGAAAGEVVRAVLRRRAAAS